MAKKKKFNALSAEVKANIRHNQALEEKKKGLDKRLNITLGVVIGVLFIAFLLLPALSMNFSGSLKDYLGDLIQEDKSIEVACNMSFVDILFAMTKGHENSIDYIVNNNSSGISASMLEIAFMSKVTNAEIRQFDMAYIASFVIAIALFVAMAVLVIITAIKRSKNKCGIFFFITVVMLDVLAALQWILFLAVGISASGKGYIQPHIASYLILAGSIALTAVYAVYLGKVRKINLGKKQVPQEALDRGRE